MCNRNIYTYFAVGLFLNLVSPSACLAEQRFELQDSGFNFSVYAGALESSHLGAFERYVFKKNASRGNGAGKKTKGLDGYFPDGLIPNNSKIEFVPKLGFEVGAALESEYFPALLVVPSLISVFYLEDQNRVNIHSPNGLGIFIDPADIDLQTKLSGWGLQYQMAIFSQETEHAQHEVYGGVGVLRYKSTSLAKINSAFLDVTITDQQKSLQPIFSLDYRYRPLRENKNIELRSFKPDLALINLKIFPTDDFFTVTASTSLSFEF